MAGVGCGMLDLVHLKYGLGARPSQEMLAAYLTELRSSPLLPAGGVQFERLLAACELHKTLYRLASSTGWDLPLDTLARWVADAEGFLQAALCRGDS
jgi:hypothetical protein